MYMKIFIYILLIIVILFFSYMKTKNIVNKENFTNLIHSTRRSINHMNRNLRNRFKYHGNKIKENMKRMIRKSGI